MTDGMSAQAARIEFLRRQEADLQRWLDQWPSRWSKRHALKKKTRQNLETVSRILRELAAHLIAGSY